MHPPGRHLIVAMAGWARGAWLYWPQAIIRRERSQPIPHKPDKVVVDLPGTYPLSQQEPMGQMFDQCHCEEDHGPCAAVLEEPSN